MSDQCCLYQPDIEIAWSPDKQSAHILIDGMRKYAVLKYGGSYRCFKMEDGEIIRTKAGLFNVDKKK